MKALSLWQPWAMLLVTGEKRIETRHWSTSYRGLLAIHASKRFMQDARMYCRFPEFECALARHRFHVGNLPLGAIVGTVRLVSCIEMTKAFINTVDAIEQHFGHYETGRYAWMCDSPVLFEDPIPYRGAQGLFDCELPRVV